MKTNENEVKKFQNQNDNSDFQCQDKSQQENFKVK